MKKRTKRILGFGIAGVALAGIAYGVKYLLSKEDEIEGLEEIENELNSSNQLETTEVVQNEEVGA